LHYIDLSFSSHFVLDNSLFNSEFLWRENRSANIKVLKYIRCAKRTYKNDSDNFRGSLSHDLWFALLLEDCGRQIYFAFYFFKRLTCYCCWLFILKQQRADTWTVKRTKRLDSTHDTSSRSIRAKGDTYNPAFSR